MKGTLTHTRTELNPEYLDLRPRAELNPEYWTPCTPLVSTDISFISHQNSTPLLPISPNHVVQQCCFRDLSASSTVICRPTHSLCLSLAPPSLWLEYLLPLSYIDVLSSQHH